jgi:NTE family protein
MRRLISTLVLLGLGAFCAAQEPGSTTGLPPAKRPKIGLVLEGGAALGLAHIGVISWLEEHHIPVSYIAGTSMGGLVGGMYATGKSPTEMHDLVDHIPWSEVLRGETPFRDLDYRRKEDKRDYPNSLEFGLKHGIRFPEGFNAGHEVGLILDRIALPYSEVNSFDNLPIPFACVATDLLSGKPYVFRQGSLATALRSTMSLPGIFSPVRTDDHIFADGGILDNLPTDVAKAMGADIVVAVHLQVKALQSDESLSSPGVLGRSVSVVVATTELRGMEKADILISVDLSAYDSLDYEKGEEIGKLGYEAAQAKAAILTTLSVDDQTWQRYVSERESRKRAAPVPQFIEVKGTKPEAAREIEHAMALDIAKPVDSDAIDRQLTNFTGVGRYSRLAYGMTEKNNRPGLLITADEKPYGPPLVQPVIVIDGSDYNNVRFKMGARLTFLDIGGFRSEWRNDVIAGFENGIRSEYYHPLTATSHWFVAPLGFADSSQFDVYSRNDLIAEYRNRQAGGAVDLGYEINRTSEVRLGYEGAAQKFSPQVGNPNLLPTVSGRRGISSIRYSLIGVDSPTVPRSGMQAYFRTGWYDANPGATRKSLDSSGSASRPQSFYLLPGGRPSVPVTPACPRFRLEVVEIWQLMGPMNSGPTNTSSSRRATSAR